MQKDAHAMVFASTHGAPALCLPDRRYEAPKRAIAEQVVSLANLICVGASPTCSELGVADQPGTRAESKLTVASPACRWP